MSEAGQGCGDSMAPAPLRILPRLIGQVWVEPAFAFGEGHVLAPGVVLDLVALDAAEHGSMRAVKRHQPAEVSLLLPAAGEWQRG